MTTERRQPRRNSSRDLVGRLATQSGPRTSAPMWPRPFFTPGEWSVYTALWSYPNDSVFPSHQDLADRAWVEWGTAKDAVAKMDQLDLLEREAGVRDNGSDSTNTYYLVEVPTAGHIGKLEALKVARAEEQEAKRRKRKAAKRKYEKPQVTAGSTDAQGGCDVGSTPVHTTGGGAPHGRTPGVLHTPHPGGAPQGAPLNLLVLLKVLWFLDVELFLLLETRWLTLPLSTLRCRLPSRPQRRKIRLLR